jgi:hypothetical protein
MTDDRRPMVWSVELAKSLVWSPKEIIDGRWANGRASTKFGEVF